MTKPTVGLFFDGELSPAATKRAKRPRRRHDGRKNRSFRRRTRTRCHGTRRRNVCTSQTVRIDGADEPSSYVRVFAPRKNRLPRTLHRAPVRVPPMDALRMIRHRVGRTYGPRNARSARGRTARLSSARRPRVHASRPGHLQVLPGSTPDEGNVHPKVRPGMEPRSTTAEDRFVRQRCLCCRWSTSKDQPNGGIGSSCDVVQRQTAVVMAQQPQPSRHYPTASPDRCATHAPISADPYGIACAARIAIHSLPST